MSIDLSKQASKNCSPPLDLSSLFTVFTHGNNTNTSQDTGQVRTHSMGMYGISLCWETGLPKSFLVCYRKHLLRICLWFYLILQENIKILRPTQILSSPARSLLLTFPGWVRDLSPISSDKAFLSESSLPILNLWLRQEKSNNYPKHLYLLEIMEKNQTSSFETPWGLRTVSMSGTLRRRRRTKKSSVHCTDHL